MPERLTVEYTAAGERRRVTYAPTADEWLRRVEVRRGCSWRTEGIEPVSGVVVSREQPVGAIVEEVDDGR